MAEGGPVTGLPHCLFRLGSYLSYWRNLLVNDWFIFCAPEGDCALPRLALHSAQHAEERHHPIMRSCTLLWRLCWSCCLPSTGELQVFLKEGERPYSWLRKALLMFSLCRGWLPEPGGLECPTSRASVSWKKKKMNKEGWQQLGKVRWRYVD